MWLKDKQFIRAHFDTSFVKIHLTNASDMVILLLVDQDFKMISKTGFAVLSQYWVCVDVTDYRDQ